jgi:hypothetical protein
MESAFRKVRLIQWALLLAWIAEIGRGSGSSNWTWRHWLVIGLCIWSVSGAFRLRSRLLRRSKENLINNAAVAKAAKQWEAGQVISLAMAEGVALWGLVIRIVFHGTFPQASIFYLMAVLLLLFWTPRMPSRTASTYPVGNALHLNRCYQAITQVCAFPLPFSYQ